MNKKEEDRQKQQQPKQPRQPALNESALRLSFLEQAVSLLAAQNSSETPSYELLERLLLREVREIGNVEQLRVHRDFKRNFCKKCFKSWVPNGTGTVPFKIKITSKAITCFCQCKEKRRFAFNPNYKSRNEKAGHLY